MQNAAILQRLAALEYQTQQLQEHAAALLRLSRDQRYAQRDPRLQRRAEDAARIYIALNRLVGDLKAGELVS